jgi:hypothetical protein
MRSTGKSSALKILLTHTPQSRTQYYGARSLEGLQAIAQVKLHEASDALDAAGLIEAARDVDIIVADRLTAGPGEIFPALPNLRAFVRCAVDIRNIDVDAASAAGVLVTRAGPVSFSRSPNSRSASWSICRAAFRAPPPTIMPRASPRSSWAGNWPAAASASSAMAASAATWLRSPRRWAWKF